MQRRLEKSDSEFGVWGFEGLDSGFGGLRVWIQGLGFRGLRVWIQGLGFGFKGLGFGV